VNEHNATAQDICFGWQMIVGYDMIYMTGNDMIWYDMICYYICGMI
jgi:hypothetical protein